MHRVAAADVGVRLFGASFHHDRHVRVELVHKGGALFGGDLFDAV